MHGLIRVVLCGVLEVLAGRFGVGYSVGVLSGFVKAGSFSPVENAFEKGEAFFVSDHVDEVDFMCLFGETHFFEQGVVFGDVECVEADAAFAEVESCELFSIVVQRFTFPGVDTHARLLRGKAEEELPVAVLVGGHLVLEGFGDIIGGDLIDELAVARERLCAVCFQVLDVLRDFWVFILG